MNPDIELNAAIARDVMCWASLGAHLWQDAHGAVYYTGHDPERVFVPHVVFNPSSDALHAMWVEEHVGQRGKRQAYIDALIHDLRIEEHTITAAYAGGYPAPEHAHVVQQALLQATPTQRCRAALQAVHHAR